MKFIIVPTVVIVAIMIFGQSTFIQKLEAYRRAGEQAYEYTGDPCDIGANTSHIPTN